MPVEDDKNYLLAVMRDFDIDTSPPSRMSARVVKALLTMKMEDALKFMILTRYGMPFPKEYPWP